jgi:hypothetical protein
MCGCTNRCFDNCQSTVQEFLKNFSEAQPVRASWQRYHLSLPRRECNGAKMRRPPLRPHFDIDRPNDFQARSSRRMNQMSRSLPYLVFLPPVSDTPFGIGSSNNCRRAKFVTMTATGSMPRHDSSKTRGLERRIFCSGRHPNHNP